MVLVKHGGALVDDGDPEISPDGALEDVSRQELIEFLGDFMSGNMRIDRIAEVAATGVDYISSGALTHSAKTLDIGLDF